MTDNIAKMNSTTSIFAVGVTLGILIATVVGGYIYMGEEQSSDSDGLLRVHMPGAEGTINASNVSNGTGDVSVSVDDWNHVEVLKVKLTGQPSHQLNNEWIYLTQEDAPYTFENVDVRKHPEGQRSRFVFDLPMVGDQGEEVLAFDAVNGGDFAKYSTRYITIIEKSEGKVVLGNRSAPVAGAPNTTNQSDNQITEGMETRHE